MKLATYVQQGRQSFGVVIDGGIVDVPAGWPGGPASLLEALGAGDDALRRMADIAAGGTPIPFDPEGGGGSTGGETAKTCIAEANRPVRFSDTGPRLLAPIPHPPKLIGLAVNYAEHHREFDRGHDLPDNPARHTTPRPFLMPATAVCGHGDEIPWPDCSRDIDYEVELAAVIGSPARRVAPQEALRHVVGYTIANDISARTLTRAEGRTKRPKDDFFDWLHGKWPDGFCPLGPWIVTAEEVGDPQALDLELRVDGEVRQQSNTRNMIFTVAETVSFLSHVMTLVPGDVIATGTPSGVGMATGKLLKAGQTIECRIERIGRLVNRLAAPPAEYYRPCGGEGKGAGSRE